ncbi:MAG: sulfite oxidase-like oxidoreductase [Chloroflexi bacterium]|nr:sulfite oxidase-like oxidoreductase [Chloroflexota bacterium]
MKGEGLPPGQRLTDQFPILHMGAVPPFSPDTWDFTLRGEVETDLRFTWPQFQALPRVRQRGDFHCVTGWSRLEDQWEGVRVRDLLAFAQPRPGTSCVLFLAEGDYTTNLPLEEAMGEDVLLALELNGAPLSPEHGSPVRLLVPSRYAYKSAKWLRGISLSRELKLGYWESRGYSSTADPWSEDRYA